jgi:SAM-dependent methyltransferase
MTAWNLPDGFSETERLPEQLAAVAERFNREYGGQSFELPEEIEAMPIFQDWAAGSLQAKLASPFWELAQPKKNQRCLDLGCGLSFLVYPWRDWQALFHGQDISSVACDALKARGPQLNSKLFKSITKGPAHLLDYGDLRFDLAIATGVSCYYSLAYWETVMAAVKGVLQSDGFFIFDVVDPDAPLADNWSILETYMGAEVLLHPLADWQALIKRAGGKLVKQNSNDLFRQYKVKF